MPYRGEREAWKLGEEGLKPGEMRFDEGVRYGLHHGRPRELLVNVALCWRVPKSRERDPRRELPEEPWYLAPSSAVGLPAS